MKKIIFFSILFVFTISLSATSVSFISNYVDPCTEAFYATDADMNGCLDIDEWSTLGGATGSLFISTDTNADGCINLAEFLGAGFICTKK